MPTGRLVLVRHGASMWNRDPNKPEDPWKYAGAVDIPLSMKGIHQALDAGKALRAIPLDVVYCSMLIRAQTTTLLALASHESGKAPLLVRDNDDETQRGLRAHTKKMSEGSHQSIIPVYCSHQLDERSFGSLQGMYEQEQQRKFSKAQLRSFRREWDVPFPDGESEAQVYDRCVGFFEKHIRGQLNKGKNVLVCCHGFVVRALLAHILDLNPHQYALEMDKDLAHDPTSLLHSENAIPRIFEYKVNEAAVKQDTGSLNKAESRKHGVFNDISSQYPIKEAIAAKL